MTDANLEQIISQEEMNKLLRIDEFIKQSDESSLISELKKAILDSGKLELEQWRSLRAQLLQIEELIPHIDLIIKLKQEKQEKQEKK
jgi:hypothetical protein